MKNVIMALALAFGVNAMAQEGAAPTPPPATEAPAPAPTPAEPAKIDHKAEKMAKVKACKEESGKLPKKEQKKAMKECMKKQ